MIEGRCASITLEQKREENMKPLDDDERLLEKLREKLGPPKKKDDRAELERLFGKREKTDEDRLRAKLVKPSVQAGDTIDVTIEKLTFGGDGIGRYKNYPVFVSGVVPGDTVRIRLTKVTKDMCHGEIIEFTAKSSNRIPARCTHFGSCGGCHLQCLAYTAQLKAKEDMMSDILSRIGGVDTRVRSLIGSPENYAYRIRTRVHVRVSGRQIETGFFAGRTNHLVAIDHCPLLAKPLNHVIAALPDLLPIPGTAPIPDEIHLQMSSDTGNVVMHLTGGSHLFGIETILDKSLKLGLPVTGVSEGKNETYHAAGDTNLTHRVGKFLYRVSSDGFFQANYHLHKKIIDQVLLLSTPSLKDSVLDLYCGCGFFSLPMAPFVQSLVGLDNNLRAVENAVYNSRAAGASNTDFHSADDKTFFSHPAVSGRDFSLIIVDPPRQGLSPETVKGILALKPQKMMYISCDPATMARDLRMLTESDFRIRVIQPVDMFPQTYHLENLVFLTHTRTGVQAAYRAFSDLH
jgi:23S rRNA (uracil1939-C5)-methyltransferase